MTSSALSHLNTDTQLCEYWKPCLRTQLCTRTMQAICALKACCSLAARQCFWMTTAAALSVSSRLRWRHPLQQACRREGCASGGLFPNRAGDKHFEGQPALPCGQDGS